MVDEQFAVTEDYQAKLLSFMLHNTEFCSVAAECLDQEQFSNKALQWFFNKVTSQTLTPVLLQEEMISAAQTKEIKEKDISKYIKTYNAIKQPPLPTEETYIREKMHTFIRTQAVKRAFLDALAPGGLVASGQWDAVAEEVTKATRAGLDIMDMGLDYFGSVETRADERANRTKRWRIPTGIPEWDSMSYGGLKNKQAGMIVGGTGRGKSVLLQWLGRVGLLLGKKVLYITMELDQEEIADRFDSMFARVRPQELEDYREEVLEGVGKYASMYGGNLKIKHFPMDQATVGTLRSFVQMLSHSGWVPDLVLVDYLDLLCPHRTYQNKVDEQDAVVKGLIGFAQEFNVVLWTATQLNRGGLVMETPDESAQAGYIGRQYVMDMVVFLAQTKEEREDEIMRIILSKNRNGRLGRIKLDTDYSFMTFYREVAEEDEDGEDASGNTAPAQEGGEEESGVEEKRDLQRLLLACTEDEPAVPEQRDGEGDLHEVSAPEESGESGDPSGGDPVPEV